MSLLVRASGLSPSLDPIVLVSLLASENALLFIDTTKRPNVLRKQISCHTTEMRPKGGLQRSVRGIK